MSSDVELLPLPEPLLVRGDIGGLYTGRECQHYARANMEPLISENERLRAEVERLRSLCAAAYQMAGVHDAPDEWLDALSNAASGRKFSIDGLLPYMPDAVCEAYARAERLAEALRNIAAMRWSSGEDLMDAAGAALAALAQEDRNG